MPYDPATRRADAPGGKQHRAEALSSLGVIAMIVAYATAWTVLSDTDLASKFENGVAPPGTDVGGNQVIVVVSIVAALAAVVSATSGNMMHSTRFTKATVAVCYLALAPFALITLVTVGLAF